jgi:hypothetical protein
MTELVRVSFQVTKAMSQIYAMVAQEAGQKKSTFIMQCSLMGLIRMVNDLEALSPYQFRNAADMMEELLDIYQAEYIEFEDELEADADEAEFLNDYPPDPDVSPEPSEVSTQGNDQTRTAEG